MTVENITIKVSYQKDIVWVKVMCSKIQTRRLKYIRWTLTGGHVISLFPFLPAGCFFGNDVIVVFIDRLKTDAATLKRQKEDGDRRAQSKLQDVRDRLEQADATNRSMRNYVNFLKTSYNNVFGTDASLTSTPVRSSAPDRSGSPFWCQ